METDSCSTSGQAVSDEAATIVAPKSPSQDTKDGDLEVLQFASSVKQLQLDNNNNKEESKSEQTEDEIENNKDYLSKEERERMPKLNAKILGFYAVSCSDFPVFHKLLTTLIGNQNPDDDTALACVSSSALPDDKLEQHQRALQSLELIKSDIELAAEKEGAETFVGGATTVECSAAANGITSKVVDEHEKAAVAEKQEEQRERSWLGIVYHKLASRCEQSVKEWLLKFPCYREMLEHTIESTREKITSYESLLYLLESYGNRRNGNFSLDPLSVYNCFDHDCSWSPYEQTFSNIWNLYHHPTTMTTTVQPGLYDLQLVDLDDQAYVESDGDTQTTTACQQHAGSSSRWCRAKTLASDDSSSSEHHTTSVRKKCLLLKRYPGGGQQPTTQTEAAAVGKCEKGQCSTSKDSTTLSGSKRLASGSEKEEDDLSAVLDAKKLKPCFSVDKC